MILRVAHNTGSEYEWRQHERLAQGAGLSAAEVAQVRDGAATRRLAAPAVAALGGCRRAARGADDLRRPLGGAATAALRPGADRQLCMLVGHYEMLAMTLNALAVEPDPVPARPPRLIQALERRRT